MVNGGDDSGGFYERFNFFFGEFKLKDTKAERETSLDKVVNLSEVSFIFNFYVFIYNGLN